MKQLLLGLFLFTGCMSGPQTHFEEELSNIVEFKAEMEQEFFIAYNVFYWITFEAPPLLNTLRRSMVGFLVLMGEVDACIKSAKIVFEKHGEEKALFCAKASLVEAITLIKIFGVEPSDSRVARILDDKE